MRACDGPVDLSLSDNSDNALLVGEAGDYRSLLESMAIIVSEVCLQRLEAQKSWGEAPESQVRHLLAEVASFSTSLDDSMRGMVGATVVLAKPNKKIDMDSLLAQASTAKPVPVEILKHFEGISTCCALRCDASSSMHRECLLRLQDFLSPGAHESASFCKTLVQTDVDCPCLTAQRSTQVSCLFAIF